MITPVVGRAFEGSIDTARGGLERPLSDSELERDLVRYSRRKIDVSALVDAVWQMDTSTNIGGMMDLVSPR